MKLLLINAIASFSILFLSCNFLLPEKHESPWFFEWKVYDKNSDTILTNSNLKYRFEIMNINNNSTHFDSLFEDTIESNGYFFIDTYSDYEEDFLNRNPYIKFKLFRDTITYLDTIIYWKNLHFDQQKPDLNHHGQANTFIIYDNNTAINNLNKLRINIVYQ